MLFFKRRQKPAEAIALEQNTVQDWSFVETDVHAHILPGIDDGPINEQEAADILRQLYQMGFRQINASVHVSAEFYPNDPEQIHRGTQAMQALLDKAGTGIRLHAGAEYMLDDHLGRLLTSGSPVLSFGDKRVLVEMPLVYEPGDVKSRLQQVQQAGYVPVIAHPERYLYYHNNLRKPEELRNMGCEYQLNVLSLKGYYGKTVMQASEQMMEKRLYDYCGTNVHHMRHVEILGKMVGSPVLHDLYRYGFRNCRGGSQN